MLHGNTDHIEEFERVEDRITGHHEAGGPDGYQRWVEQQVDRHLERVASKAETHLRAASFQEIIVGGPREIVSRFESALTPAVRGASPVASRSRSPTRAPTRSGAPRSRASKRRSAGTSTRYSIC